MTSYQSFYKQPENERKTYPTKCSHCGEKVFWHTNGNGDFVMFNALGLPWEKHSCWANYSKDGKDRLHREGGDTRVDPYEQKFLNCIQNNKYKKKFSVKELRKKARLYAKERVLEYQRQVINEKEKYRLHREGGDTRIDNHEEKISNSIANNGDGKQPAIKKMGRNARRNAKKRALKAQNQLTNIKESK